MIRRPFVSLLVVCATVLCARVAAAIDVDPGLAEALAAKDGGPVPVLLIYDSPRESLPAADRERVLSRLRARADREQAAALRVLRESGVTDARSLYLAGAIAFTADRRAVERLAGLPDPAVLFHDRDYDLIRADRPAGSVAAKSPAAADTAWNVAALGAPRVWGELGYDGNGVVVGHIDTGVWLDHPDLAGRLWANPGEVPGNGVDDDGNGFVDDVVGWDFGDGDADPNDDSPSGGHGTHTAGSVVGDGTQGTITGVAPGARLMACKVWRDSGAGGSLGMIWAAEQYCVENGARIITMSLGFPGDIPDLYLRADRLNCEAIRDAGVTLFNSAGNEHFRFEPPLELALTARVPSPWVAPGTPHSSTGGVITVGGTGYLNDDVYANSSRGPAAWGGIDPWHDWPLDAEAGLAGLIKPDVAAPGVQVNSTVRGGGYSGDTWSGTSMACPLAAGVAALMLQKNPSLSPAGIDSLLQTTADDLGEAGKDNVFGAGRVDAYAAVTAAPTVLLPDLVVEAVLPDPAGDGILDPGASTPLAFVLTNVGPAADADGVAATLAVPDDPWVTVSDPTASFTAAAAGGGRGDNRADPFVLTVAPSAPHGHRFTVLLTVSTPSGFARTFDVEWYVGLPDWRTHDVGDVYLTVTDQGILGYMAQDGSVGAGFGRDGSASTLFVGSFWAGTGADYVCGRDYEGLGRETHEWVVSDTDPNGRVRDEGKDRADQSFGAVFTDGGHASPRGLLVHQTSLAFGAPEHSRFVILEYGLTNRGDEPLSGLHAGVYCDFDIGAAGDLAGTDPETRLAYLYEADGVHCGVALLGSAEPANLTGVNNITHVYPTSTVADATRMKLLDGTISEPAGTTPTDWSTLVSTAVDLEADGGQATVAFAVVYGETLEELMANARAADEAYDPDVPIEKDVPLKFVHLDQNRPNPFNPETTIRYVVREAGRVTVDVYDVAGRHLRSLIDGPHDADEYEVAWDGRDGAGRAVASGTYVYRMSGPGVGEGRLMTLVR